MVVAGCLAAGLGTSQSADLPAVSDLVWTGPDRFWFRKTVPGGHLWLNVDAEHGVKEPLFDHQRLAIELGIRTGNEYEPLGLPLADRAAQFIVKYDGSNAYIQEGAMAIEFVLDGARWRCDLQTKWDWNKVPPTDYVCASRGAVLSDASIDARTAPAMRASPDGRWEAIVQDYNVAVRAVGGGAAAPVSTDGVAGFAYQAGSIAWTADSKGLAAYRVNEQVWLSVSVAGNVKTAVVRSAFRIPPGR